MNFTTSRSPYPETLWDKKVMFFPSGANPDGTVRRNPCEFSFLGPNAVPERLDQRRIGNSRQLPVVQVPENVGPASAKGEPF